MRQRSSRPIRLDQAVTRVLIRLGGLAAIAVLVAAGVSVTRTALSNSAERYYTASQALAISHSGMLDQETALRGFLDTGQSLFLQPFRTGQQELAAGDAQLEQAVGDTPSLVDAYVAMRLAQDAWVSGWASPAGASGATANSPDFLAAGKALFDSYRAAATILSANLETRLQNAVDSSSLVAGAGLAVEVPIALAGGVLWWRSRRRLRQAVVGPVGNILRTLERFEAGDFTAPQGTLVGPAELQEVTRRLSTIAEALSAASVGAAQREREAAEHAARLRGIVDMGREIAGSLNLRYVLQAVSHSVMGIGCGPRCVIWLTDDSHGTLIPVHDSAGIKGRVAGLEPITIGDQAMGKAARFGRMVGPEQVSHPGVAQPWSHAIAVPMIVGARVVGVIETGADHSMRIPTADLELLDTLSSQAATAIEAARLYERAEHQSRTDALTLLPNRHDLDSALAGEVSRAERYQRPLSVAMLDLDHFKLVNDTFGHARGDEVLQETAAVMRSVLRDVDMIYRYGGEEFLVVMPETGRAAAVELCNRLRQAVSERVVIPDGGRLTVSGGVASYPDEGGDPARLISSADDALYRAKRSGRDRVMSGGSHPEDRGKPTPKVLAAS